MLQRSSLSALAVLLLAVSGCDLLFGAPPTVIGNGRRPGGDEGEGEEGEGEEGEGEEGEGEPDVPPDIRPDPQGPNIQSIALSTNRLDSDTTAELTVVVTDVDGAGDIIGPLLIEPISGRTLGTLSSPAAGTFTATISWNTWSEIDPISFISGGDVRFIRVQFSDNAGHQVTATERIDVFCGGNLPACDNRCGSLECQGECFSVDEAPSAADLCGGCNIGCQANAPANAACFNPSPSCAGGADCVIGFTLSNETPDTSVCRAVGAITLREDNVAVWRIGGADLPLFISNRSDASPLGQELCADHGGLNFVTNTDVVPAGLTANERVVDLEDDACVSNLASCEPVTGRVSVVGDRVDQYLCNEPVNPDVGTFGHACFNGSCTDGSFCDSNTQLCAESCSQSFDCDACTAASGASCTCNTSFGRCESLNDDEGGLGEPCRGGSTCDDTNNLFCDSGSGTCLEFCSSSFDCDVCNAANSGDCTCNANSGVCEAGGASGDFSCVVGGNRNISAAGSFSGSTTGKTNAGSGSCQPSSGPDEFWKFTPPTSGTWTFSTTASFDTVIVVRDACGGLELGCDDDGGAANNNSRESVVLSAGVPVLVTVDGFNSASGSYTLTISN